MAPVTGQPQPAITWMDRPTISGECPPGLEYLTQIDQLVVKQQVELLEVITGFETENKYRVFNSLGQQVYFASEESGCCSRQCCDGDRGFTMHITDNNNEEVMKIVREFKCCADSCGWCACVDCCACDIRVYDRQSNILGYVRQSQSAWKPKYEIRTPEQDVIGKITGPCCTCSCGGDVPFPVLSPDETVEIGKISKQWTGWAKELFTDADTFSVTFPMDMDVRMKASFLAALFLIDFMYFEDGDNNDH